MFTTTRCCRSRMLWRRSYYKLNRVSVNRTSRVTSAKHNIFFFISCKLCIESWKRDSTKREKLAPRDDSSRNCTARRNFPRRRIIVQGYQQSDDQADIVKMRPYSIFNPGHHYIFTVIDVEQVRVDRTDQEQRWKRDGWRYRRDNSCEWKMFPKNLQRSFTTPICRKSWKNTLIIIPRWKRQWSVVESHTQNRYVEDVYN